MTQPNPNPELPKPTEASPDRPKIKIDPTTLFPGQPRAEPERVNEGREANNGPGSPEQSSDQAPLADVVEETGVTGTAPSARPVLPVSSRSDAGPLDLAPTDADHADDVYTPAPTSNPVVEALVANGLYLEDSGEGFHRLTCPWASEHPPEVSSQAAYLEPCFGRPFGQFKCTHKHTETRDAQCLIDHLGIGPDAARAKAVVYMQTGETYRAVAASERVLARAGQYFNATGPIVRIVTRPGQDFYRTRD